MGFPLVYLEIENFKSYEGFHNIGPISSFLAVIGPNGSGKSNFMDAISFVFGEKKDTLRVKRLADFIHGASVNRPSAKTASVTATFHRTKNDSENEGIKKCEIFDGCETRKFQRSIINDGSCRAEYRIGKDVVSTADYMDELKKEGINVQAKNFLVPQGHVESISMKNPKELTTMFEELSGSIKLKQEYEKIAQEMQAAEAATQASFQKKKELNLERKDAKLLKEEKMKYEKLQENLSGRQTEINLFRLFHTERKIEKCNEENGVKEIAKNKIKTRKEELEEKVEEAKKANTDSQKELTKCELEIRSKEEEISKNKKPAFIKAKEKTRHKQQKVENATKTLKQEEKALIQKEMDITNGQKELREVELKLEKVQESDSNEQGKEIKMLNIQLKMYKKLKEEARPKLTEMSTKLDKSSKAQQLDEEKLDLENRKKDEVVSKIRVKEREKEECQKRLDKLQEHSQVMEKQMEEQEEELNEKTEDGMSSKEKVAKLTDELERTENEIQDITVDKQQQQRDKQQNEIVTHLKKQFTGVYDLVINMTEPEHKKYNVAITKKLGGMMNAIIVDTEKTARECIQYLKDQMIPPQTFLALDYVKHMPLQERLRTIKNPKGVKLLYDVLRYQPEEIKKVILYVTANTLICETTEDANYVAYEMEADTRYCTVALDGTLYEPSGVMSGGSTDLARRAKRWDDKQLDKLKEKKERLSQELNQAMKNVRKESEIITLQSQINGNKTRIKSYHTDMDNSNRKIGAISLEIRKIEIDLRKVEGNMKKLEDGMADRKKLINELKEEMNKYEDGVFASFCVKLGIKNIRQYEERELKEQQENEQKKLECEKQKEKVSTGLEFDEKRKDELDGNVKRCKKALMEEQTAFDKAKKIEASYMEQIDSFMHTMEKHKTNKSNLEQKCYKTESEVSSAEKELDSIKRELTHANKIIAQLDGEIESHQDTWQQVLRDCKLRNIIIPLSRGMLSQIDEDENDENNSRGSSFENIKVKYGTLDDGLTELEEHDDIRKVEKTLENQIDELNATLKRIHAPNAKELERLDETNDRLKEVEEEFDKARKLTKEKTIKFNMKKEERHNMFMECFNVIQQHIDDTYKQLVKNQSAQAFLNPENSDEPYLEGINFNCVAPGKRFQPMQNLSGGEKTMAALALLFSINKFKQSPFFVLDEIDAALDNTNIAKVAKYIENITEGPNGMRIIVISLKDEFYSHAEAVIGVCPDNTRRTDADCLVSSVFSMDLSNIPKASIEI